MALVNAVSGEPEQKGPSSNASRPAAEETSGGDPSPETATSPAVALPLVIRVTGPATYVFVRVADTGKVLTKGTLNQGETRNYKEAPLQVVAYNGGAVQVVIHGKVQPPKADGQRGEWFVKPRGG
ncbi:RodZ domain-containing protein [Actinomadura sp. KC06]|uniref:RodZ domain-containing protein n=1 Tax=Actinomadura sp. KC06 TaxID=2530369 RepID=UPI001FB80045|nr:RodZ domain-containing protein [Actinomadura sp. KC06]